MYLKLTIQAFLSDIVRDTNYFWKDSQQKHHDKTSMASMVLLEIVVWIYDTFVNNLGTKYNFTKYLKESCSL